jgi:NAD(P)-dependent dehydrogenase (short-subunit alcohol dehydrogenase family)
MGGSWTAADIPDQDGRVAIVTGANSGIGFETARELARRGATVVLACRSEGRGDDARNQIRAELPDADVRVTKLDLADLDQVREFAAAFGAEFARLDLLINNAGVMVPPEGRTEQGSELQFAINHLGHFALTGLLLDLLLATPGARVVTVSSQAHRQGTMDFEDLDFEQRGYQAAAAYGQSKLANLLFTFELDRRLAAARADVTAAAAHPGWTVTNLQRHSRLIRMLNPIFGMNQAKGALPTLRAATAPDVPGGDYFGPGSFYEMRGYPKRVGTSAAAQSPEDAERLWTVSEERTGVTYEALAS